jgi:glycosyltransferase involved in cell wall biosynthesis
VTEYQSLSVVVPVYNERTTVVEILRRMRQVDLPVDLEIVVVDDGSNDGTEKVLGALEDSTVRVIHHTSNQGKGAAIRTGLEHARGDLLLIQDADLEYDPDDVPRLVRPILDGYADVVYGSRLKGGAPQRAFMFWHLVGNRFLSLLASVLYDTPLSDIETGYKAFRTETLRSLRLREDGFGVEPEITAQVCRRRLRIYELPISYYGRGYADGKKITWRHGIEAVRVLFEQRLDGRNGSR